MHDFPFDTDSIELEFWTASTFRTFDGSSGSAAATGRTYEWRAMTPGHPEGNWLALGFDGEVDDLSIGGVSTKVCGWDASVRIREMLPDRSRRLPSTFGGFQRRIVQLPARARFHALDRID